MSVKLSSKPYWESIVSSFYLNAAIALELIPKSEQAEALQGMIKQIQPDHRPLIDFVYKGPLFDLSSRNTPFIDFSSYTVITTPSHAAKNKEGPEKEKKKKELDLEKLINGIASGLATLLTGYFLTAFWDARKIVNVTGEIRSALQTNLQPEIFQKILELVNKKYEIDLRNYWKALEYLSSSTLLLMGFLTTFAGESLEKTPLVRIGYITMFIGCLTILFTLGAHWKDNSKNLDCYRSIVGFKHQSLTDYQTKTVEGLAVRVQKLFPSYNKNMESASDAPPQYGEFPSLFEDVNDGINN